MRIVIIDDEPLAREELRYLLTNHPDCTVVGEAEDGPSAVRAIEELKPDVVLLDVQMPGFDGFDVLRAVRLDRPPRFVFVTAYDRYAVRAFEVTATDYLLKPVAPDRLARALDRCRALSGSATETTVPEQLRLLLSSLSPRHARQLVGRKHQRIFLIPVDEVLCLEMESRLVFIVTEKDRYWTNETLGGLLERLDPERFVRVHRRTVVRLDAVRELAPLTNERMLLRLCNGHEVTASRNHLADLKERLGLGRKTDTDSM